MTKKQLIIGISGASGTIYGIRLLEILKKLEIDTHLVMTQPAEITMAYEMDMKRKDVQSLATHVHQDTNIAAPVASGSFRVDGMIIAPCSMNTLGELANGITSTLLPRAADVILKERKKLVLLARETPLHAVHLRNMLTITEMGGIIAPPVPAFYNRPETLDDMVNHTVGRVLDLFGIDTGEVNRWGTPNA